MSCCDSRYNSRCQYSEMNVLPTCCKPGLAGSRSNNVGGRGSAGRKRGNEVQDRTTTEGSLMD